MTDHTHQSSDIHSVAAEGHDVVYYAEEDHDHDSEYAERTHAHDSTTGDLWDAIQSLEDKVESLEDSKTSNKYEEAIDEVDRKLDALIGVLSEDPNLHARLSKALEEF